MEQFDQRIDLAGTGMDNVLPFFRIKRFNLNVDLVKTGSADLRNDLALRNLQIQNGAIPDIAPSPRKTIGVVAVGLQVIAPGIAPEGRRDLSSQKFDGFELLAFLLERA